jgi:hypothetical protein
MIFKLKNAKIRNCIRSPRAAPAAGARRGLVCIFFWFWRTARHLGEIPSGFGARRLAQDWSTVDF